MASRKYFGLDEALETLLLEENNELETEECYSHDELTPSTSVQLESCEDSSPQEEIESRIQLACTSTAQKNNNSSNKNNSTTTSFSASTSAAVSTNNDTNYGEDAESHDECPILKKVKSFLQKKCCNL